MSRYGKGRAALGVFSKKSGAGTTMTGLPLKGRPTMG